MPKGKQFSHLIYDMVKCAVSLVGGALLMNLFNIHYSTVGNDIDCLRHIIPSTADRHRPYVLKALLKLKLVHDFHDKKELYCTSTAITQL